VCANELFGHVKGAFTGAHADKKGLLEAASGGTLFLDEITEMSPTMQVKLLRVIQEKEVLPLGATTPVKIDVRFIAATNRPPAWPRRATSAETALPQCPAPASVRQPP
jgi:transcriptional regulator with PAS, ATPase and Fis domain